MNEDETTAAETGILHPQGRQAARDLAAGVVHEINNMLGVIVGNIHLAKKNRSDEAALERYLGEVQGAAEAGRELMRELSSLAEDEGVQTRVLSLNDLVHTVAQRSEHALQLDLSGDDPAAQLNLWLAQDALSSVIQFMASTTTVSSIRIATRVVASATALTIEDDGVSPGDKDIRLMFTPFAKLDRRPNVRLALTKLADLAQRSGGHVSAGAREPHGLRIVLTLPVAEGASSGDGPGVPLSE